MNIVYCHHAQRNRGKIATQNDDITKLGKKDAEIVSELLDELQRLKGKVVAIYTAEFLRCTKTAEIINQKIKVPVFVDARFFTAVHISSYTLDGFSLSFTLLIARSIILPIFE